MSERLWHSELSLYRNELGARIRLRTVFLLFVCAAVGLATGAAPIPEPDPALVGFGIEPKQFNWHYGLLSAASMAMVIGLGQQIRQLRTHRSDAAREGADSGFELTYAIVWRAVITAALLTCIVLQLLISRQILKMPEHKDMFWYEVVPDQLMLLCVVIVISNSIARGQPNKIRPMSFSRRIATWLTSTILILVVLPHAGIIWFLVYCALNGIEAAQPGIYHRPGSYPDHAAEGFFHFWACFAMSAVVALAAGLFLLVRRSDSATRRRLKLTFYFGLMSVAVGFCIWYRCVEIPRIAPDIAEVGLSGNWIDYLGGSAIVIFAVSIAAYRRATGEDTADIIEYAATERVENCFHETVLCQLALIGSGLLYLGEFTRSPTGFMTPSVADVIYVAEDPTSILCVAVMILSIRLSWILWQRRHEAFVWRIVEVDRRQFVWNWLGLAALVVIGIQVLAAYCFGFWLGPWYLYGT